MTCGCQCHTYVQKPDYRWSDCCVDVHAQLAEGELKKLRELLDTPEIHDFMVGLPREAAHQVVRWGPDHDWNKKDSDFLWVLGRLASKIVDAPNQDKRLHHIVTSAALLLNWHRVARQNPIGDRKFASREETQKRIEQLKAERDILLGDKKRLEVQVANLKKEMFRQVWATLNGDERLGVLQDAGVLTIS